MHRKECFTQEKRWNKKYHSWLKTLQTPIFMQKDWPDIPMAVRYPLERVTSEFRTSATGNLYATNHCAYMIALALMEGVTHIGLYGCQYSSESEHGVQRDSLSYWLGRFEQAGGKIVIPPVSNTVLCSPKELYGYESHDADGKLVPAYRSRFGSITKSSNGAVKAVETRRFDFGNDADRKSIPDLGNGEAPDWDRASKLFGAKVA